MLTANANASVFLYRTKSILSSRCRASSLNIGTNSKPPALAGLAYKARTSFRIKFSYTT